MATPQNIRRYHIFLASPGDVGEHRGFVRAFFGDYNIQHAAARGIEFQVVVLSRYRPAGGARQPGGAVPGARSVGQGLRVP